MVGIYKITNPKGKIYIGQSVDIDRRLNKYNNLNNSKNQTKLHNSLIKYGFSEHNFEIIEECKIEELNIRERYWQDLYDVVGINGLNCRLTGNEDKSGSRSKESVKKQSTTLKAYNKTSKGFESRIKAVSNTDYISRTLKTDFIQISIKRTINTDYTKKYKPILQISLKGEIIQEWDSTKSAKNYLNLKHASGITNCLTGLAKSAYGYKWEYK